MDENFSGGSSGGGGKREGSGGDDGYQGSTWEAYMQVQGCSSVIAFVLIGIIAVIAHFEANPPDFSTFFPPRLPYSTHFRRPLPYASQEMVTTPFSHFRNAEAAEELLPAFETFHRRTGITPYYIYLVRIAQREGIKEAWIPLTKTLYYDENTHTYFSIDTNTEYSAYSEELDLRAACQQIYNHLFLDEAHMLVVEVRGKWGYDGFYYTGEEAATVFDDEAGYIYLDKVHYAKKRITVEVPNISSTTYTIKTVESTEGRTAAVFGYALTVTAKRIMGPPIQVYLVGTVLLLVLLMIWRKKRKRKKALTTPLSERPEFAEMINKQKKGE